MVGEQGALKRIQELWSSEDPYERIRGWLGKVVVEGTLFGTVSFLFTASIWALTNAVEEIGLSTQTGYIAVWVTGFLLLFHVSFCRLIPVADEWTEGEDDESGTVQTTLEET